MLKKNLEQDLKNEIKRISDEIGIKVSLTDPFDKIVRDYLTVRLKLIEPKKRMVLFNPTFFWELEKHPNKKEIIGIGQIANSGGNLNIFQSKRLLQTRFHDHLLSEWNIYHFHLSLEIDKKSKFVKQVNNMLFAYIDNEQVIILGTEKHKTGIFADVKWIEILHDHFPNVISRYKDDTIKEIRPKVNSIDRQMLWNKGYTLGMTKVRDTVYHNPGAGRSTSGHSSSVIKNEISILRWIIDLNKQLDEYPEEICAFLKIKIEEAEFRIKADTTFRLFEESTGLCLLNYPEIFISKEELVSRINTGYNIGS